MTGDKRFERAIRLFAAALEQEGIDLDTPCPKECFAGVNSRFEGYCGETNRCLLREILKEKSDGS